MSTSSNENQDAPRSRSSSHSDQRSADITALHAQVQVSTAQSSTSSAPSPGATPAYPVPVTTTPGHPLHEFRSLLEAAERIARAPVVGAADGQWTAEGPQPDPIIRLLRPRQRGDLRRVPLTRTYSGRPHIPGEDSGSDSEEEDSRMDIDRNAGLNETRPVRGTPETNTSTTLSPLVELVQRDMPEPGTSIGARGPEIRARSISNGSVRRWRPAERLQDYASNHVRRNSGQETTDTSQNQNNTDADSAPRTDWPETRLRVRGAAIRPELALDINETVNRATAAGRDLERALQEYRIARRILRPHIDLSDDPTENAPGVRTATASTAPVRNRSNTIWAARTGLNSIHDFINTDRSDHPAYRNSLAQGNGRRPGVGESSGIANVLSVEDHEVSSRQSETRARLNDAIHGMNERAAATDFLGIYRNFNRERQEEWSAATGFLLSYRNQSRIRRERHRRLMRENEEDLPSLASGPLFEGGGPPGIRNRDALRDLTPRPPATGSATAEAGTWTTRQRRILEQASQAQHKARSMGMKQAKAALEYLAHLRKDASYLTREQAWDIATELGLHNQNLEHDSRIHLAMSIDELPEPAYSSWLEPGTVWRGFQSAAINNNPRPVTDHIISEGRAMDERERVAYTIRQTETFLARSRDDRERLERAMVSRTERQDEEARITALEFLQESPRYLDPDSDSIGGQFATSETSPDLIERQHARLRTGFNRLTEDICQAQADARDLWNVQVALHSVDWDQMTLTGTMTASHRRRPRSQVETTDSTESHSSMDSFFTGEIVDFRTHGLDKHPASSQQDTARDFTRSYLGELDSEHKCKGSEMDLTHWADLGPFKREIDHAVIVRQAEAEQEVRQRAIDKPNGGTRDSDSDEDDDDDEPEVYEDSTAGVSNGLRLKTPRSFVESFEAGTPGILSEDEKLDIKLRTMTRLLSDTKWLHENINQEGWILMRWKERCFVSPGSEPNPPSTTTRGTPVERSGSRSRRYDPYYTPNGGDFTVGDSTSSALSLRRRRDRIWTTVESERDEQQHSTSTQGRRREDVGSIWGLSISGFYYVALNRQTGEIEALYYDSGSPPFQRLTIQPLCLSNDAGSRSEPRRAPGGIRTNFNFVEHR